MVYFFTASNGWLIYMGKDKHENEDLIKYAWNEDIWFHVTDHSSAHVYLRLPNQKIDMEEIPEEILMECAVLTKKNSIEGNKKHSVSITYTPATNLKKTPELEIGEVMFHDKKKIFYLNHIEKNKDIFKTIKVTEKEMFPDLEKMKEEHLNELNAVIKKKNVEEKQKTELQKKEKKMKVEELKNARDEYKTDKEANYDIEDFL